MYVESETILFTIYQMAPKAWKKLQQFAYLFYLLMFVHILAFEIPKAMRGVEGYTRCLCVFFVVFKLPF